MSHFFSFSAFWIAFAVAFATDADAPAKHRTRPTRLSRFKLKLIGQLNEKYIVPLFGFICGAIIVNTGGALVNNQSNLGEERKN